MRKLLRLLMAAVLAVAAGYQAYACDDARKTMAAITKGDWTGALELAERCVAEDRAASPSPSNLATGSLLTVFNVHFWELGVAILNAKLGRHTRAEQALANAVHWAQQYGIDDPKGLAPVVPLTDAARGYLAERRGDKTNAIQHYNSASAFDPGLASSRLALMAIEAGDESGAQAQAEIALKHNPQESTALYVLGTLAERRNAFSAAVKMYELALSAIAQTADRNPSFPLRYIEQDRIAKALAAARMR